MDGERELATRIIRALDLAIAEGALEVADLLGAAAEHLHARAEETDPAVVDALARLHTLRHGG
ncbi:MAG TPA: hypothetical protein VD860_16310 [Azospirillum sp.]|nr:hypothetical protein [Azospirillum sp.]